MQVALMTHKGSDEVSLCAYRYTDILARAMGCSLRGQQLLNTASLFIRVRSSMALLGSWLA